MNMLQPDLRLPGLAYKLVTSVITEKNLKKMNTSYKPKKIKEDNIVMESMQLKRVDGTDLRVCIFKSKCPVDNVPGVLWIHGGGYFSGHPEDEIGKIKIMIESSNCVVISPDYKTSLEEPYPAALDDCYQALLWMNDNTEQLGIRENQLLVGGESAGAGLAAAVCLYSRDKKGPAIAYQMLLYPMIDDRMNTESMIDNDAPVWNERVNRIAWKIYLGNLYQTKNVPKYAAPSRETDYSGLPPTLSYVSDIEPFRDETIHYVENLKKTGIPVDFALYHGGFHGFDGLCPKAKISKQAIRFFEESFKHAVANYFSEQKSI